MAAGDKESWDRAKSLILGAVETIMQLKGGKKTHSGPGCSNTGSISASDDRNGAQTSIASIGGGRKFYLGGQIIIHCARSAREIFDHAHLIEV